MIIPKGSILFDKGIKIAEVIKDLPAGYVPQPEDFNPFIPKGTTFLDSHIEYQKRIIYRHPYFLR